MENCNSGLLLNLVPKIEPPEAEFVVCGEYVEEVPNSPAAPILETSCSYAYPQKTAGSNLVVFKDLRVVVRDCLQEIAAIKANVKNEPEENIFDDSQYYDQINEQITGYESTSSENDNSEDFNLKSPLKKQISQKNTSAPKKEKGRKTTVLKEEKSADDENCNRCKKILNPKTKVLCASGCKKYYHVECTREKTYARFSKMGVRKKRWKCDICMGIPLESLKCTSSENDYSEDFTLKSSLKNHDSGKNPPVFKKEKNCKTTDPEEGKLINDSQSKRKRTTRISYTPVEESPENILPPTAKRKRAACNYEVKSSSESDDDRSYDPEPEFEASCSPINEGIKETEENETVNVALDEDKSADDENCNKCKKILNPETKVLCANGCKKYYHVECTRLKTYDKYSKKGARKKLWKCDLCIQKHQGKPRPPGKDCNKCKMILNPKTKVFCANGCNKYYHVECTRVKTYDRFSKKGATKIEHWRCDSCMDAGIYLVKPKRTTLEGEGALKNDVKKKKKKKKLIDDEAQRDAVLWFCCDLPFEQFSDFNAHKVKEHLTDELKCSVCVDQSFASLDEIEKHYLDSHAPPSSTSFHCSDCRIVFGVKSSFVDHQAKCPASKNVGSGILDSAENPQEIKVNEDTPYKLSCCEKIIESFEEFDVHKFSDHNIALFTCGLCLCEKDSEKTLRFHYKNFHFSTFWKILKLENEPDNEDAASEMDDDDSDSEDEDYSQTITADKCSSLQDGILCGCSSCKGLKNKTPKPNNNGKNLDTKIKPFACKICNLRFRFKSLYERHQNTHEGRKLSLCNICNKAYSDKWSLKFHFNLMHSMNLRKETCNFCNKSFLSNHIQKHIHNVHYGVDKTHSFKCKYCSKSLSCKSHLQRHINNSHLRENQYECQDCNKVFHAKETLVEHIKRYHLPNETVSCNICGLVFKTKPGLYTHMQSKHSKNEYSCEVCGMMFTAKHYLKFHMITHSVDKRYVCQTCGKQFKRPSNLLQHQYTHSDSRPHVCNICGQTFRLRTHVKQHMAVHGMIKNHKCVICETSFAKKAELKSHLLSHGM